MTIFDEVEKHGCCRVHLRYESKVMLQYFFEAFDRVVQ